MKKKIRSIYKLRRKSLDPEKVMQNSKKIIEKIIGLTEKIGKKKIIKNIGIYMPIRNEVNLLNLLKNENFSQKSFFLPKTNIAKNNLKNPISKIKTNSLNTEKLKNPNQMDFFEIEKNKNLYDQLKKGNFGILEPNNLIFEKDLDIVFTPLIAFDENLNRIGFGKGFYDCYFSRFGSCIKIGVAHGCQEIEEETDFFEEEEFNVKLDFLVTEDKVFGGI